jgi:hypothetical protein
MLMACSTDERTHKKPCINSPLFYVLQAGKGLQTPHVRRSVPMHFILINSRWVTIEKKMTANTAAAECVRACAGNFLISAPIACDKL